MRDTCLYCEQEGETTYLIQTHRGGLCPIHSAAFLASLEEQARAFLGVRRPELLGKGVPQT